MNVRCKHFGECGGCKLQDVAYARQLEDKEGRVRELFGDCMPIVPCDEPWAYRNKMEFSFSQDRAGRQFLGLMKARGRVVNLDECHLVNGWMCAVLESVRKWWGCSSIEAFHPPKAIGTLRTLTLREGFGRKMVILTINGASEFALNGKQIEAFKEAIFRVLDWEDVALYLAFHRAKKGVPTEIYEMHLSGPEYLLDQLTVMGKTSRFLLSPQAFFQPNRLQAEKLYTRAFEMAELTGSDIVFDLYCGVGSIGMCASPFVQEVMGIELNPYAVCDARVNLEENGVENMVVFKGDVPELMRRDELSVYSPDLVICDPPRAGMGSEMVKLLREMDVKKVLYISCNPVTQVADVEGLVSEGRFKVAGVQPVDQFPHTPHIENIVLLTT